jgi:predicted RNA-binding Zn ribbon-like protein
MCDDDGKPCKRTIVVAANRVRKCEGCPVHFLDVSKKGSRRWCSMGLCGNKVKVAAYQQRQRKP